MGDLEDRELARLEAEQAEKRQGVRPHVVHEVIRRAGELELGRPWGALAWSGLAAGLAMGFSLVGEGLLRAHLPDAPWRPLVAHAGYTLGFLFVILGRQHLFTEDTLLAVIPLLSRRDRRTLGQVARLWSIVLVANIVGALIFTLVVAHIPIFEAPTRAAFQEVANEALRGGAGITFGRAIFAGWIIALMVWMLPAAEHARVPIILIMTYVVALGGLAHIIAGASETLFGVVSGTVGVGRWFGQWFLPTLAGNIVGGVGLVSAVNHAQVVTGENNGGA